MIAVPDGVRASLAAAFGTRAGELSHFAGGHDWSFGVVWAYPHGDGRRLLKVMAFPAKEQRRGRFVLDERLRFMRYLGEHGARVVYPENSPQGNLYETVQQGAHLWVGYCMEIAPGEAATSAQGDARFVREWGRTVGQLHRLAQEYPSWRHSLDPESGQAHLTWEEEWQGFDAECQDEQVRAQWGEIRRELEALPITRDSYGFVHNDPHFWNLLVDGDRSRCWISTWPITTGS